MGVTTVNHSKDFVNPSNPKCYTNGIESKWREVKRQLPSSGRYRLNEYLPIHCWLCDCKRLCEDRFWSLMKILSEKQEDVIAGRWKLADEVSVANGDLDTIVEEEEEEAEGEVEVEDKFFGFFCGRDFKTKQGCNAHQRNCDEAHLLKI